MNIFAALGLSGNSGASKVLCSLSALSNAVENAGRVVSLQTDECLMGGLGKKIYVYIVHDNT